MVELDLELGLVLVERLGCKMVLWLALVSFYRSLSHKFGSVPSYQYHVRPWKPWNDECSSGSSHLDKWMDRFEDQQVGNE